MQGLRLLFSPSGRLSPRPFVVIAVSVYILGAASHLLTAPGVIGRYGLWLFLAVQIVLIWVWYAVHAKRLRDAGSSAGAAAAVAVLYALSIALLVIIAVAFYVPLAGQGYDPNAAGALGLILFAAIIALLADAPHYDVAWLMVALLVLLAVVPIALAVATTLLAAIRPRLQAAAS